MRIGLVLVHLALLACAPDDLARHDAGRVAVDGGRDGGDDALAPVDAFDPGPSFLEATTDATRVEDWGPSPRIVWNGETWGLWFGPLWMAANDVLGTRLRELEPDGTPAGTVALPPMPPWPMPMPTDGPVDTVQTLVWADDTYVLAANDCARLAPCNGFPLARVARDGSTSGWVSGAPDRHEVAIAWTGAGFLTLQYVGTTGFELVRRDETLARLSDVALPESVATNYLDARLAISGAEILVGLGATEGSPFALLRFDANGERLGAVERTGPTVLEQLEPWTDGGLALFRGAAGEHHIEVVRASGFVHRGTIDPPWNEAEMRLAPIPERALTGLCWESATSTESELYLQLFDVAAGRLLGLPTLVTTLRDRYLDGHHCAWNGASLLVVWSVVGDATYARSYDVLR